MISTQFRVHGIPKPQPRPRAFQRNGMTRVFTAGTAEAWKSDVAAAARGANCLGLFPAGAVALSIIFLMPRPKSHFRTSGAIKPTAPSYHTSKPDMDNLAKSTMDCLSQIGVWTDDAQVCQLTLIKMYDHQPGAQIFISSRDNTTKETAHGSIDQAVAG